MQREAEAATTFTQEWPLVQWANGLLPIVQKNPKGQWVGNTMAVGFIFPRNENADDRDELDAACEAAGYSPIFIKRKNAVGASAHWFTPELRCLVLHTGKLPRLGPQHKDRETLQKGGTIERGGISYGWKIVRDRETKEVFWDDRGLPRTESFARPLVIVPELVAQGYEKPVMLTFNVNMTGKFFDALNRFYDIQGDLLNDAGALEYIEKVQDTLVADYGVEAPANPDEWKFPFYGSYLMLGDGGQEPFGKGDKTTDVNVVACLEPESYEGETYANLCADANERAICMEWMQRALPWSVENTTRSISLSEQEQEQMEQEQAQRAAMRKAAVAKAAA